MSYVVCNLFNVSNFSAGLVKSLGRGATVACYEDLRCQIPSGVAPPGLAKAPPPGFTKAPVGAPQAGCAKAVAPPPGFDFKVLVKF